MWTTSTQWLIGIFYLVGLYLFIRGCIRYKIQIPWILLALLGPYPFFILYECKRRGFLRNAKTETEKLRIADKRVRASIWFAVISIGLIFFSGVGAFYTVMDGALLSDAVRNGAIIQFWGLVLVTAVYGLLIFRYDRRKQ